MLFPSSSSVLWFVAAFSKALNCVKSFLLVPDCLGLFLDEFGCSGLFLDCYVLSNRFTLFGLSGVDLVLPFVSDCMKLVLCFWLFSVLLDRFGLMKFQVV